MKSTRMISLAALALVVLLLSGFGCAEDSDNSGLEVEELGTSYVPGIDMGIDSVEGGPVEAVPPIGAVGYSLDEIAAHSTVDDCWMAIDGSVYDVTSFVSSHPGGNQILRGCGLDATQLFDTKGRGEAGPPHSPQAERGLANYLIGILK